MFSSLAAYIFGSNTSNTNSETTATTTTTPIVSGVQSIIEVNSLDLDNLIEVTSLTPSVTGTGDRSSSATAAASNCAIRRGKHRRNNARQQNKRKGVKSQQTATNSSGQITSKQTTPGDSCDEDFDENEWYIVEKDEYDVSPPRNDSEGKQNGSDPEIVKSVKPIITVNPRRLQNISSHCLYSGPKPQKHRNYLHKSRNNNTNTNNSRKSGLSVSTLSPSRTVNDGQPASGPTTGLTADVGLTRSLYAAPPSPVSDEHAGISNTANGIGTKKMDESWFVTPPPCFTSIGPINMEISPYENLLIEHPSMSVYHKIRTAQEAAESFVKLDLGVKATNKLKPAKENVPRKTPQPVQQRPTAGFRLDRQSVAQLKQELMARSVQKSQSKWERKDIRRSAIKRANKAREVQSKNHTSRRSDRQQCKVVSGANNNRKSCF